MISEKNIERAKNEIKKTQKPIVVLAQDDKYNRAMLEYGKFQVLLSPEKNTGKGKLKKQESGLNHVLAKIAAKNGIAIGIDVEEISKLPKTEKGERLAKVRQNIQICRKAKAKIKVFNFTSKQQAFSLMLSLGSTTQQANEAITF
ncbi:hypothetical protein CO038_01645 [Candidatus Pacearchaeota archaeon CG_4_9_14_0_2_um_filter_39_13]|nr:hypothetical protein [Candidatus Pacearchaeota archaeon]OIO42461.1 MAG: hypothetical protein AUJ64_04085 [Candidatus Pacearchaeota archaeon CG1_02_39_14]PJC44834.1 MAG: hypothetical protein CO038_01645 [Candidatus Pacearchaeota archaeon CG_4_9_14_0_2_um_filter_39_13]